MPPNSPDQDRYALAYFLEAQDLSRTSQLVLAEKILDFLRNTRGWSTAEEAVISASELQRLTP